EGPTAARGSRGAHRRLAAADRRPAAGVGPVVQTLPWTAAAHEPVPASVEAVVGALARARSPLSLPVAHGGTAFVRGHARPAAGASFPGPPEPDRHVGLRLVGWRGPEPYA